MIKAADESVDRTLPKMDSEYSMGYQLTMELLKEDRNFTAIAGQNDMMALGAIDALEESRYVCRKMFRSLAVMILFILASGDFR